MFNNRHDFALYAMEQEGLLDTRQSIINRAIRVLAAVPDDADSQERALSAAGIDPYGFTAGEIAYINSQL